FFHYYYLHYRTLHSFPTRRSSDLGGGSLVSTKLFLSKTENTISEIPTGQAGSDGTYIDGTPSGPPLVSALGDGTVLSTSVVDNLGFVGVIDDRASSHPSLMSTYSDKITAFLQPSLGLTREGHEAPVSSSNNVTSEDL